MNKFGESSIRDEKEKYGLVSWNYFHPHINLRPDIYFKRHLEAEG
jgi:hypothetical protein